jgi:6-phosphogluconolactonase
MKSEAASSNYLVYVGTYTAPISHVPESTGKGIHIYEFSESDETLNYVGAATDIVNPSYLAISANRRFLYAVSEVDGPEGYVAAYAIDPESGLLTFLNRQPAHGEAACYLVVENSDQYLLTANYMSGSACVYPIKFDGRLDEVVHRIEHNGSGPHPRQECAHIHCATLDPENRFVIVSDLGIDRLTTYGLDRRSGTLISQTQTAVRPAGGPRHFVFSQDGRYGYSLQELDNTIDAFSYDPNSGTLEQIQTCSTVPENFEGDSTASAIRLHPNSRFLYASNRGHDSIAVFHIDSNNGLLSLANICASDGQCPRDFNIVTSGKYLLVGHQNTDDIVIFRINQDTGDLESTNKVKVPTPVCIQMLERKGG